MPDRRAEGATSKDLPADNARSGDPPVYVVAGQEVVWLAGADRLDFLHRMSAGPVADLAEGSGRTLLLVDDAGQVVDLVTAYHRRDGTALLTSGPGAGARVAQHLGRYVLYGDDVRVTDATQQVLVFTLLGPGASRLVTALSPAASGASDGAWLETELEESPLWLMRASRAAGLDAWFLVAPLAAADALKDLLAVNGADPAPPSRYGSARVRHGIPAHGAEFSAVSPANPLELELKRYVDFAKGCYIGQEVVARLDTYDKVQRRLVRITSANPLAHGDIVTAPAKDTPRGKFTVGQVTTVATSLGDDINIALALVPQWMASRERLTVRDANGEGAGVEAIVERLDLNS